MGFTSWQRYCMVLQQCASAKLCGVEQRSPPVFNKAAITLGIDPHSSFCLVYFCVVIHIFWLVNVCFCCVRFCFFSIPSQEIGLGTSPKWPILCRVRCKTLTSNQSCQPTMSKHWCQPGSPTEWWRRDDKPLHQLSDASIHFCLWFCIR